MKRYKKLILGLPILGSVCVKAVCAGAQEAAPKSITAVATEQISTAKELINLVIEFMVKYSFQLVGGIIVLVLGWVLAKYIANLMEKFFEKKKVDVTVSKFIINAVKLLVMAFAVTVALGKFGIEIAPLIAGVSVAGFGLSFALQGPLSNYASGATLIFTKPFKVGDIIEVVGVEGEVLDMKLPRTELRTVDGNLVVVPNKHIVGEIIHNYSNAKRVDINVGVSYSTAMDKAISVVKEVIQKDKRVVKEPVLRISEFADSSINIYARVWCRQEDYWSVMFDINRNIWEAFGREKIEIPFPQRDVYIKKTEG